MGLEGIGKALDLLKTVIRHPVIDPAAKVFGEQLADRMRYRRAQNILNIDEKFKRLIKQRGLNGLEAKVLADHVGLLWIERASLCGDDYLQERWAELLVALKSESGSEYSAGATYVRILGELEPWDCNVLGYMVKEGGLSKSYFRRVPFWEELKDAIPTSDQDPNRTVLSLEKLVRLGCLEDTNVHPSRNDRGISMYGGIARHFSLTVTGLRFHIAVTGREPGWLSKSDELRDDVHPIKPLPQNERKGISSVVEQDRFVRFVADFESIHYRLLNESKGDIRTVRDTLRSIDGAPGAALVEEGRNPHPIKPGLRAWTVLYENGLVNVPNPEIVMSEAAYRSSSLTPLGLRFLKFVERDEN